MVHFRLVTAIALLLGASLLLPACAGSMPSASSVSEVVKRPVRASKGSVETSSRK